VRVERTFLPNRKEKIMKEYIQTTKLNGFVNPTHLIIEVFKVMNNAKKEIYFATRYHDPHISAKVFEKFRKGVTIQVLEGNPEQISDSADWQRE
jgi:hypothetical protein